MLPDYFEFTLPTKVIYGIGILGNLGPALRGFGRRRALLVTDAVLEETGLAERVRTAFAGTVIEIRRTFSDVPPNSTIATVEACAEMGRADECDLVIAVGGGSVIDTAKVTNLLLVKGGRVADHLGAYLLSPAESLLPSIIIPTTAGTGSEVTKVAVIADPDADVKLPFAETQFLPDLAILDPEMTVSMPGKLTAATGMDALTHAVEAYVDREWSPASDALALHAIRLISENILRACARPDDLQARGGMLVGSFLAGVAFSHSMVGMAHGIAHALGGVYHIPHGLANALVLPEVMAHNLDAAPDRFADIAEALGVTFPQLVEESQSLIRSGGGGGGNILGGPRAWLRAKTHRARNTAARAIGTLRFVDGWMRKAAARAGVERVRTLNRQLAHLTGIPLNLKDAGVTDNLARLEQVATTAMEDGSMLYNPVEPGREAVIKIVQTIHDQRIDPLPVDEADIQSAAGRGAGAEMTQVFADTETLYDVLIDFYERLKADPEIGPALLGSNLCVQFVYKKPSATITIDARGETLEIFRGDFDGTPEVTMTMNADFAHKFWHGRANLVSALTRRQVVARGNVPKTLKLLPILKPAYALYPQFLREKGLGHLVMS